MGTTRLEVFVNVTGFSGPPGTASSGSYFLYDRHPNLTREQFHATRYDGHVEGDSAHFANPTVDHFQHDPPYAELSRWLFRVNTYAGAGTTGCNGCVPYELSYRITVVAWNDDRVDPSESADADEPPIAGPRDNA